MWEEVLGIQVLNEIREIVARGVSLKIKRSVDLIEVGVYGNVIDCGIEPAAEIGDGVIDGRPRCAPGVDEHVVIGRPECFALGGKGDEYEDEGERWDGPEALGSAHGEKKNGADEGEAKDWGKIEERKQAKRDCATEASRQIAGISMQGRHCLEEASDALAEGDEHRHVEDENSSQNQGVEPKRAAGGKAGFDAEFGEADESAAKDQHGDIQSNENKKIGD